MDSARAPLNPADSPGSEVVHPTVVVSNRSRGEAEDPGSELNIVSEYIPVGTTGLEALQDGEILPVLKHEFCQGLEVRGTGFGAAAREMARCGRGSLGRLLKISPVGDGASAKGEPGGCLLDLQGLAPLRVDVEATDEAVGCSVLLKLDEGLSSLSPVSHIWTGSSSPDQKTTACFRTCATSLRELR